MSFAYLIRLRFAAMTLFKSMRHMANTVGTIFPGTIVLIRLQSLPLGWYDVRGRKQGDEGLKRHNHHGERALRAYIVAVCAGILGGCATVQETADFNTALYSRCTTEAATEHIDPIKKCGSNPATYKASFSEKYDYFRDQEQARRESVAAARAAEGPQAAYARSCYAAAMVAPSSGFAQSLANANVAYQQCLNGLPMSVPQSPAPAYVPMPFPQQQQTTNCTRQGGGITCTTQ
jgi:hypothetical protein